MNKLVGYVLIRAAPEEGKKRNFTIPDMEDNEDKKSLIPVFKSTLEENDIEIFKIIKHSFITSDGVYTIMCTDELEEKTIINLKDE